MSKAVLVMAATVFVILATSCDDNSHRLAQFARLQAEQDREMAQVDYEVTSIPSRVGGAF